MHKAVVAAALATAFLGTGRVARAAEPVDALSRIESAYAEGRIDAPARALLGLTLARDPSRLPAEFRPAAGEAPLRCGTLLVRRATLEFEAGSFSPEQEAQYLLGVGRPSLDSEMLVMDSSGANVIATLHYASAATTLSQAQTAADFLTDAWFAETDTMGWRVPPPDAGAGGADPDVELDVYLDPAQNGAVTVTEGTGPEAWDDAPSFIVVDPTVTGIETFLAHELHHSVQYAYDRLEADFLYEATAVWMEDQVFDSADAYVDFLPDFQTHPERTLTFATYADNYMYGGAIFVHYLASLADASLIRTIWDASKQTDGTNSVDFFDAIVAQSATTGFSDMASLYADFAGVRFLTGAQSDGTLEEGPQMDPVSAIATLGLDALEGGTSANPPMGLGANYIVVNPSGAEPDDTLTLSVHGDDDGPWAITVVSKPSSGAATVTVVRGDAGEVEATAEGLDALSAVAFAVSHLGGADAPDSVPAGGGHSADVSTHGFSYTFSKDKKAAGCGCQIPARSRPFASGSVVGMLVLALGAVAVRRNRPER